MAQTEQNFLIESIKRLWKAGCLMLMKIHSVVWLTLPGIFLEWDWPEGYKKLSNSRWQWRERMQGQKVKHKSLIVIPTIVNSRLAVIAVLMWNPHVSLTAPPIAGDTDAPRLKPKFMIPASSPCVARLPPSYPFTLQVINEGCQKYSTAQHSKGRCLGTCTLFCNAGYFRIVFGDTVNNTEKIDGYAK